MLIYIHGADSFLAREAILSIKNKYLEKNPSGTELIELDCLSLSGSKGANWADLRTVPLFATSRLIIIRQAGELTLEEQESLAGVLTDLPSSSIVVLWDGKTLKTGSPLSHICDKGSKKISAEPLAGPSLVTWIKKEAAKYAIEPPASLIKELIEQYGGNLWAIRTDLMTRTGQLAKSSHWGQVKAEKPFVLFDDIRSRRWADLRQHLVSAFERGEPLEMSIGSLAAVVRQSVDDKSLRRKIVTILSDVDQALKTGLIESGDAVALLAYYLPDGQKRVQWEELCEQLI